MTWGRRAALVSALLPGAALASSHREAPLITEDPAADNTDFYLFSSGPIGTVDQDVILIANFYPLQQPAGGPNFHRFSDDVLYSIHLTRGDSLEDAVRYDFRFSSTPFPRVPAGDLTQPLGGGKEFFAQLSGRTQTLTVTRVVGNVSTVLASGLSVAPANIGPRTNAVAYGTAAYDDAFAATFIHTLPDGSRVFAGPRDDGFYVDLGGVFDLANLRNAILPGPALSPVGGVDGVAGFNVLSIALEVPASLLTANGQPPVAGAGNLAQVLGGWASASRKKFTVRRDESNAASRSFGEWVQVSRLGLPLINEVVIGLQDKDKFNGSHPRDDLANFGAYFLNPVIVRDAEAVGIYAALGVPQPVVDSLKTGRLDIVNAINLGLPFTQIGDVLRLDLGTPSQFPNGRAIPGGAQPNMEQVDVTDVLMTVVLAGGAVSLADGVNRNDVNFLASFPYLALPHQGRNAGLGQPTP